MNQNTISHAHLSKMALRVTSQNYSFLQANVDENIHLIDNIYFKKLSFSKFQVSSPTITMLSDSTK